MVNVFVLQIFFVIFKIKTFFVNLRVSGLTRDCQKNGKIYFDLNIFLAFFIKKIYNY